MNDTRRHRNHLTERAATVFVVACCFILSAAAQEKSGPGVDGRGVGRSVGVWESPVENPCAPKLVQAVLNASPKTIVEAVNRRFQRPRLKLRKVSRGQAEVVVVDSEYLTERMGSTGASIFMISVTYSLTSLGIVEKVKFRFEEGSHAAPGTFDRDSVLEVMGCNK
jgi:hypothetical protein